MTRVFEHRISETESNQTVQSIILREFRLSRALLRRCKVNGSITLDGLPAHTNIPVQEGQLLSVALPGDKEAWTRLRKTDGLPDVIYEDEDLLILNKPAPLSTMTSGKKDDATLEDEVYTYFGCPEHFVYRPVNRLDKGTSGLMAVAKNVFAQEKLQRQLHTPLFVRQYQAVLDGILPENEGTVRLPILKSSVSSVKRTVGEGGRPAVTYYRNLERYGSHTLVQLRLETGRTHQIRVHMAALGCPVTGDALYGTAHPLLPNRFALHSFFLSLSHPVTQKTMEWRVPPPAVFNTILHLKH